MKGLDPRQSDCRSDAVRPLHSAAYAIDQLADGMTGPVRFIRALSCAAAVLLAGNAQAAENDRGTERGPERGPDRQVQEEIQFLLLRVEHSGCEFYRNGTWHPGPEARAHLTRKFQAVDAKGLIRTTDDFIRRVAAESSLSGTPYRVRCGPAESVSSEDWFRQELARHRKLSRPGS